MFLADSAGFIEANFFLEWFEGTEEPDVNLEKFTYAGNLEHLESLLTELDVFDVAVDLRRSWPNFGKWVGVVLSTDNKRQLRVPPSFVQAFVETSEEAEFLYKTTDCWYPEYERRHLKCAPPVGVQWSLVGLVAKDAAAFC